MEYLQYNNTSLYLKDFNHKGFKPCYKWNTFNTGDSPKSGYMVSVVLNLVINGIPSILKMYAVVNGFESKMF